jgi:hypothetical protein
LIDYNICLQQFDKLWENMKAYNDRKRKLCEFAKKNTVFPHIVSALE